MRSKLSLTLIGAASVAFLTLHAQQGNQSAASRLSSLVLDVLPAKAQVAAVEGDDTRLGSLLLAQIPPQNAQGLTPGQNPNTIRPNPGTARPTLNRNPRAQVPPPGAPAGSPGPSVAPTPTTSPAPAVPPPGSPVIAQPTPANGQPMAPKPPAPSDAAAANGSDEEMIELQLPNVPMPQILMEYENLTGKKIIRDINVEAVTFTIETNGKMPKKDAIEYMEKSLLLNGYGFIPAGEKFVKFVNMAAMKPGPEHPIIYTTDALPKDGEAVVTYIQPLQYLEADDLKKSLTDLVPLHAYGVISAMPNSRGIAITENSNTIRYIIELLKHLDVEPSRTEKRTFQLTRSSAEDVAKALADILGLESKGSTGGSGGKTTPQPVQPQATPAGIPNQPGAAAAQAAHVGVYGSAPQAAAVPPKIIPIPRTQSLLVIARPTDLDYIGSLIDELDAQATIKKFITYPLHYLDATNMLQILGDSLQALVPESGDGGGGKTGGGSILGNTGQNNNQNNQRNTSFSNSMGGNSGFGNNSLGGNGFNSGMGSGFGSGGRGGGSATPLRQNDQAMSLVVGKSLLIADPTKNEIFVTGPPEHLETVRLILEELDVRPKAVVLSVVIGTMGLDDNREFGIDYLFHPQELRFNKLNGNVAGTATTKNGGFTDTSTLKSVADFKDIASGISLFGTFNDAVTIAVKALNAASDFKTLARPSIYTLNNQPATIQTGQKVPVPTSTYNNGYNTGVNTGNNISSGFQTNIAYQDVFLSLSVAPLILNDNEIKLNIHQENNSLGNTTNLGGNPVPSINSQGLDTTVLVKNNSTVLLGGLISEDVTKSRNGIPILKDIPIVKHLFSSTSDKLNRHELLIFISPRIVSGEGDEPPNYSDSTGDSALGKASQEFMRFEHTNPAQEQKDVKRTKLGKLMQKLFN